MLGNDFPEFSLNINKNNQKRRRYLSVCVPKFFHRNKIVKILAPYSKAEQVGFCLSSPKSACVVLCRESVSSTKKSVALLHWQNPSYSIFCFLKHIPSTSCSALHFSAIRRDWSIATKRYWRMWFDAFSKQGILNVISQFILRSRLLSFQLVMCCATCFFQGKRKMCCRELLDVCLAKFLLSSAITAFQTKIIIQFKVQWRIAKVTLKGLLHWCTENCSEKSVYTTQKFL